jgi:hypothetical protein
MPVAIEDEYNAKKCGDEEDGVDGRDVSEIHSKLK